MRVLYYYAWGYFAPIGSGADVVAANQLEYFRRRGWEVDCLLPDMPDRAGQAATFRAKYPWLRSVNAIRLPGRPFTFRDQLFAYHRAAEAPELRAALRAGADLFFTNYAFTAPLAEHLPRSCKRVLEAVDIIARSFALAEDRARKGPDPLAAARDAFHHGMEMELYRLFDAVLFLNEEEKEEAEPNLPGRAHFVPPTFPPEIDPSAADRPASPSDGEFDLIFVGSGAGPNTRGITWFYRNVYVPYLRRRGVRMAIAGNVCRTLDFDDWQVAKLGRVDGALDDLYARSKVVVVPILEGTGLSIKTLECLAMGRATVTAPAGARGMREDPEAFARIDMKADPRGTAEAILGLLDSPERRGRMGRAARAYFERHYGRDCYFAAMDRAMAAAGLAA